MAFPITTDVLKRSKTSGHRLNPAGRRIRAHQGQGPPASLRLMKIVLILSDLVFKFHPLSYHHPLVFVSLFLKALVVTKTVKAISYKKKHCTKFLK